MRNYSTTEVFDFGLGDSESVILACKMNGGSIAVAIWDGIQFVDSDTISTDGGTELRVKGAKIRFTPSGGATYGIAGRS